MDPLRCRADGDGGLGPAAEIVGANDLVSSRHKRPENFLTENRSGQKGIVYKPV